MYNFMGGQIQNPVNAVKYIPLHHFIVKSFSNVLIQQEHLQHFRELGYTYDKVNDMYSKGVNIKNLQIGNQHEFFTSVLSFYPPLNLAPVNLEFFHLCLGESVLSTNNFLIFNFLSRFPCYLYLNNIFCYTNVATLLIHYTRVLNNPNGNDFILSQYLGTNILQKIPANQPTDQYLNMFYAVFSQHFDSIVSACYRFFYNEEHGDEAMPQCFFFQPTRLQARSYPKNIFDQPPQFNAMQQYANLFNVQVQNPVIVAYDGFNSNDQWHNVIGQNHMTDPYVCFSMMATLEDEKQDTFFKFIGSLIWFYCKYNMDFLANQQSLFIYLWCTLLYRTDLNLNNTYNYQSLLYNFNQCITQKIFYMKVLSNNSSNFYPSTRSTSFHIACPYAYSRFEITSNFLTDFYPFVSFFIKLKNKPEELAKLTDFGRNLLSRILHSFPRDMTTLFIPNYA